MLKFKGGFFYDRAREDSKIVWVKWSVVRKSKNLGGLGVCDLWVVNLALLGKWRWWLISDATSIWRDVLAARYGVF